MTVLNWRRWFKLLCYVQCTDLATPKISEMVKMLEGGDGFVKKWEAMKNIEEPNLD